MFVKNVFVLFNYFLECAYADANDLYFESEMQERPIFKPKYSWIGVLHERNSTRPMKPDVITGIILVAAQVAIGNAYDVARINAETISEIVVARFYWKGLPHQIDVHNYTIHPEYRKSSYNTIALIHLDPKNKYAKKPNFWNPINWPNVKFNFSATNQTYAIGFYDKHKVLLQQKRQLKQVFKTICRKYYSKRGLDIGTIWPRYTFCYRDKNDTKNCLYDAGMALVIYIKKRWVLLGMSTYGPGCSAPARFIKLFPYTDWILSKLPVEEEAPQISRRQKNVEWNNWNLPSEPFVDRDRIVVNPFGDGNLEMYFIKKGETFETSGIIPRFPSGYASFYDLPLANKYGIWGHMQCPKNSVLQYKENGFIKTVPNTYNIYYFWFSFFDLKYSGSSCVRIKIRAVERSKITYMVTKGFGIHDLHDKFINKIPFQYKDWYKSHRLPKILYLKEEWRYTQRVLNIWFKVSFSGRTELGIEFWGHRRSYYPYNILRSKILRGNETAEDAEQMTMEQLSQMFLNNGADIDERTNKSHKHYVQTTEDPNLRNLSETAHIDAWIDDGNVVDEMKGIKKRRMK